MVWVSVRYDTSTFDNGIKYARLLEKIYEVARKYKSSMNNYSGVPVALYVENSIMA